MRKVLLALFVMAAVVIGLVLQARKPALSSSTLIC